MKILPDNMVFKVFLLSLFHLVFLLTILASLPPGVMLLNRSTTPRDSATNNKKTYQKGVPEGERPNRSVVKKIRVPLNVSLIVFSYGITAQNTCKSTTFQSCTTVAPEIWPMVFGGVARNLGKSPLNHVLQDQKAKHRVYATTHQKDGKIRIYSTAHQTRSLI